MRPKVDPMARFTKFVSVGDGQDSCWIWTASTKGGYGQFYLGAKRDGSGGSDTVAAHRFAYEQAYGLVPVGMLVRHLCDEKRCVRPSHLAVGDSEDNAVDRGKVWKRPIAMHHCPTCSCVDDQQQES